MDVVDRLTAHVREYLARLREAPVTVVVEPDPIRHHLAERYDFSEPVHAETLFDDVTSMLWRWTEHAGHPMHYGLFRPRIGPTSVIAEALVALYDPNLATWDFSPVANEIERHTLRAIALCFDEELAQHGASHFTSGGQEANHTAVAVALSWKFPEIARQGLRALRGQPVFYVSEEGHHSFDKIAHSTGLGRDAVRVVPADETLRMDVQALAGLHDNDRRAGRLPFMVVGTAGTTNAGIVDPLARMAAFARDNALWFHVDAAWGGAAALSSRLKRVLAGIEQADSITCDAHKWFSVCVGTGMFFCRHPEPVSRTFHTQTAYVPDQLGDRVYPFVTSMQWSRRFTGLKLFMTLAELGLAGMAARIERQAEMGDYLRMRLRERGFVVLNDTPLPVVCFTHPEIDSLAAVVEELRRRNLAWISKTALRGKTPVLRACIANVDTGQADVDRLVDYLEGSSTFRTPESGAC